MINSLTYFVQYDHDPYLNLALEEYFLRHVQVGQCILYLWQNENTIVIGKNQNAWSECKTSAIEKNKGRVARRLSGGGAVYHDLGNQNFTFLLKENDYDVTRQTNIILHALSSLGIKAKLTGRNDLTIEGKKFSGHAYYSSGGNAYHHGTLMVDVDEEKLSAFLNVSKAKLEKRSIASVRSRVINLKDILPDLNLTNLREALVKSFAKEYGLEAKLLDKNEIDMDAVLALRQKYSDWDFIYGSKNRFPEKLQGIFPWGEITIDYVVDKGHIKDVAVYSDSLDADLIASLPKLLRGTRYEIVSLNESLSVINDEQIKNDLLDLFSKVFL
ncbi:MAG: lipoate--protein ligase [Phascolarctobacterium sp.]|nr:lipoate--protein ligase [Phascolarctobacterium sp.]